MWTKYNQDQLTLCAEQWTLITKPKNTPKMLRNSLLCLICIDFAKNRVCALSEPFSQNHIFQPIGTPYSKSIHTFAMKRGQKLYINRNKNSMKSFVQIYILVWKYGDFWPFFLDFGRFCIYSNFDPPSLILIKKQKNCNISS